MCNNNCDNNEQREDILEILKDFKCLDKIREEIERDYNIKSHFKQITNLISKDKEMIYYGGPMSCVDEDAKNKEYISNRHYKYWINNKEEEEEEPFNYTHCLCFHCIKNLCYIKNIRTKKIYVVGNECINKFVDPTMQGRLCKRCKEKHKNHKDNYCNKCRIIIKEEIKQAKEEQERLYKIERNKKIEEEIKIRKEKENKEHLYKIEKIKEEQEKVYQEYLKNKEIEKEEEFKKDGICKFGTKYKGSLYIDIFNNDTGYIKWIYNTFKKNKEELGYIKKDNLYYFLKLYNEFKKNPHHLI